MLYHNLRFINYLFAVFGLKKPFPKRTGEVSKVTVWDRLWTLVILSLIITCYCFVVWNPIAPDIKNNLELICESNEFTVCSLVIVAYLVQNQSSYYTLYNTINGIIRRFNIQAQYLRKFCWKLYTLTLFPFGTFIALGIWVVFSGYSLPSIIVRIPLLLENIHLLLNVCMVLALLKALNAKLATKLNFSKCTFFNVEAEGKLFALVLNPADGEYFETKYLCHIYDDLCQSMKLLEKQHGVQILLESWMIFVSTSVQFTLMASQKDEYTSFNALRLVTPLLWYTMLGFLDDQIRQEVEQTEIIIMKHLIDFRCDEASRRYLTTFKQLVSTNRLRLRACGLLNVNYAMVLGTIVSVVTYSIIMIQLFMDK